jgi:hypothetical protein
MFGDNLPQIAFIFMVAVSVGGILIAILFPYISGSGDARRRVRSVMAS